MHVSKWRTLHYLSLFTNYVTRCSLGCSTSSEFSDLSKTSNSTDRGALSWRCNRSISRRWLIGIDVDYFTVVLSIRFIGNGEKVPRSLCTRFIFILVIALAHCSLGHDHRSTIDLWLDVRSFCSCNCSRALTAANCHYALWRQISHVHVTILWRECFYGAIWSWILITYSWFRSSWTSQTVNGRSCRRKTRVSSLGAYSVFFFFFMNFFFIGVFNFSF